MQSAGWFRSNERINVLQEIPKGLALKTWSEVFNLYMNPSVCGFALSDQSACFKDSVWHHWLRATAVLWKNVQLSSSRENNTSRYTLPLPGSDYPLESSCSTSCNLWQCITYCHLLAGEAHEPKTPLAGLKSWKKRCILAKTRSSAYCCSLSTAPPPGSAWTLSKKGEASLSQRHPRLFADASGNKTRQQGQRGCFSPSAVVFSGKKEKYMNILSRQSAVLVYL